MLTGKQEDHREMQESNTTTGDFDDTQEDEIEGGSGGTGIFVRLWHF